MSKGSINYYEQQLSSTRELIQALEHKKAAIIEQLEDSIYDSEVEELLYLCNSAIKHQTMEAFSINCLLSKLKEVE